MFGERFQLSNTLGKLLNIEPDAGEITKKAEAFIKSFTAGDRMNFERKFKDPVSALPTARLIIGTNSLPKFEDRSSGIWRRMILLPFQVVIPAHERDRKLAEKLKEELPGILNWSLEGLRRLRAQEHFTEPKICKERLQEYRTESNPARLFLTENYAEQEGGSELCGDAFRRYTAFCKAHGYDSLTDAEFGKEVRRVFPAAEKKRDSTNGRPYRYHGIAYIGTGDGRPSDDEEDVTLR
jgi:putative DNA primase/helicase